MSADQLFVCSKLASPFDELVDLAEYSGAARESSQYEMAGAVGNTAGSEALAEGRAAEDSAASRSCSIAAQDHLASVEDFERREVEVVAFLHQTSGNACMHRIEHPRIAGGGCTLGLNGRSGSFVSDRNQLS